MLLKSHFSSFLAWMGEMLLFSLPFLQVEQEATAMIESKRQQVRDAVLFVSSQLRAHLSIFTQIPVQLQSPTDAVIHLRLILV